MKRAALAAVLAMAAQPAAAVTATFDFNAIADGAAFYSTAAPDTVRSGFEGNWNMPDGIDGSAAVVGDGEGILDKTTGIEIRARGLNSMGFAADAFLDSRNAGLGVCSYGSHSPGFPGSCKSGVAGAHTGDDNLNREDEALVVTFSTKVRIESLTILNATHQPADGPFDIGGATFEVDAGVVDPAFLRLIPAAKAFQLKYMVDGPEIYVGDVTVAAVPLPAGALLLGTALAGLGAAARRRRAPA